MNGDRNRGSYLVSHLPKAPFIRRKITYTLVPTFVSDILKLAAGTVFAQALGIMASPILTRIYGPEAYGLAAIFISITSIAAVVACLRYEMAIMLSEKDDHIVNLLALSLLIAFVMSCMTALVIWLSKDMLVDLLNAPGLGQYLYLIPFSVFLSGVFSALSYWSARKTRFGRLSIARVSASISTTSASMGAGLLGYPTGGCLIGAGLLGSSVSTIMLCGKVWRDDSHVIREFLNCKNIIYVSKRYKKFPILDSWASLLNSISWQLPIFLLSSFFSSIVVGFYSLSLIVLQLPMNLIGSSIGQVFFQRAAITNSNSRENLTKLVEDTVSNLCIIGLFPMLLLLLAGDDIFAVIFGTKWAEAGTYAQILAPWIFFWFIYSPTSTLFSVFEMQGNNLIFNILLIITRSIALILGGFYGDARIALALFSIFGILVYGGANLWLLSKANVSIVKIIKELVLYFIYSVILLGLIVFSKWCLIVSIEQIFILSCITIFFYYLIIAKKFIG